MTCNFDIVNLCCVKHSKIVNVMLSTMILSMNSLHSNSCSLFVTSDSNRSHVFTAMIRLMLNEAIPLILIANGNGIEDKDELKSRFVFTKSGFLWFFRYICDLSVIEIVKVDKLLALIPMVK